MPIMITADAEVNENLTEPSPQELEFLALACEKLNLTYADFWRDGQGTIIEQSKRRPKNPVRIDRQKPPLHGSFVNIQAQVEKYSIAGVLVMAAGLGNFKYNQKEAHRAVERAVGEALLLSATIRKFVTVDGNYP